MRRRRRSPTAAPAPFVVGVTRSGTTLLRLMLDAHREMAVPPETHFVPKALDAFKEGEMTPERFVDVVAAHRRWPDFQLEREELVRRVAALPQPLERGPAVRAFYELYAAQSGKSRWGDKTPGYLKKMGLIARHLPEARFVHLIRDGRDVAMSITGLHFGPDTVRDAARRWVKRVQVARRQAERVPGRYLEVRYEDLVTDAEPTLRRICEYVELAWDEGMLAYHESAGERLAQITRDLPRSGPSGDEGVIPAAQRVGIHALASQPPQSDRVGVWRTKMTAEDQAVFLETAGELLNELGYPAS